MRTEGSIFSQCILLSVRFCNNLVSEVQDVHHCCRCQLRYASCVCGMKSSDAPDALQRNKVSPLKYEYVPRVFGLLFLNSCSSMSSTEPIDLDLFKFEEGFDGDDLYGDEVKHEVLISFDCPCSTRDSS